MGHEASEFRQEDRYEERSIAKTFDGVGFPCGQIQKLAGSEVLSHATLARGSALPKNHDSPKNLTTCLKT
jgi:hypothetical protein